MTESHYASWMLHVCIDVCSEVEFKGTVYSLLSTTPTFFDNMTDFLLTLDRLFDQVGYPQSFQDKRSFITDDISNTNRFNSSPDKKCTEESFREKRGKIATYVIAVRTRKDTSWQGAIFDLDFHFIKEFDSELDLMRFLIDETK